MIRKQRGSVVWYEFELLQSFPYLRHGCFTSLSSLNVGNSPKEPPHIITSNRQQIAQTLFDGTFGSLLSMQQVHGSEISIVNSPSSPEAPCDAMATNLVNVGLLVQHADCQAGLFFDPEKDIIAAVHSGWRGSIHNIYKATVERLKAKWGCREEALIACISPSLGPCHAEFQRWREELPSSFDPFRQQETYYDFWEISRAQLLSCGLLHSNIEIAGMCTYCNQELFFSYRRDKTHMRNATCISLIQKGMRE